MHLRALDPCVTVVPASAEPTTGTPALPLAITGGDPSMLPWVVTIGAVLVLVGVVALLWRHRRRLVTMTSVVVLLAVSIGAASAIEGGTPAHAAGTAPQECALIALSDIRRADSSETGNLLPGQRAQVLSLTVTNVTAAPIDIRAALAPTAGDPSSFIGDIETDAAAATGRLSDSPSTAPLTLAPGARLDLRVSVQLAPDAEDAGTTSTFDTVLTAVGG